MALKHKSLGFNNPSKFNDPMEGRLWLHQMGIETTYLDASLENFGILCLTKNPLNPLMWSHYGQSHTGFVIGYDVNEPILGHQKDSVFTISDGKIFHSPDIFLRVSPDDVRIAIQWAQFGMEYSRCERIYQILRHIFLMKQKFWSYEEEIRVVKILYNIGKEVHDWVAETGNNFQRLSTPVAPMQSVSTSTLSLLNVSNDSIRHIILGMKNPLLNSGAEVRGDSDLSYINEGGTVKVDKVQWSSDGHSLEAVEAKIPTWGTLNSIGTKYLSHIELEAISNKRLPADAVGKQGLTLTHWTDGNVEAFWDDEL